MADTGWKSPGTVTEDTSVGSSSWNNYGNVTADDCHMCLPLTMCDFNLRVD